MKTSTFNKAEHARSGRSSKLPVGLVLLWTVEEEEEEEST